MAKYDLIGATGCATGIAHTYMAQEALEQEAKKRGLTIKVETHGQTGVDDPLTQEEIDNAKAVIVASDIDVDADRFAGLPVIMVPVAAGIKDPGKLFDEALAKDAPIYKEGTKAKAAGGAKQSGTGLGHLVYTSLMNGVSHMLPVVVAGGVLTAISFFWGIYSADPKSVQFNAFAAMLNTIGGYTMNLMVPVLCAYIAEAIAKRSGLIVGFAVGMIALNGGTGFLGGIVGGYVAGAVVILLQHLLKPLPDKEFRGLKAIFLYPVLGVFIAGMIMWVITKPMAGINTGMMSFLKGMQNSDPIVLGLIVGIMCASDFGGPINKAAYLTGTALLAQGNAFFMAGVSAACIAPPIATGIAVLLNPKAYNKDDRSAGYVNFLLGSTHITEGAIPFAAKNPLLNIPSFMIGSAVAAILTYMSKIQVPAPHGGFIILPLVNHPILWVVYILIGSAVSGILLAIIAGHSAKKHGVSQNSVSLAGLTGDDAVAAIAPEAAAQPETSNTDVDNGLGDIIDTDNIVLDMTATDRNDALKQLAQLVVKNGIATDADAVYQKYLKREDEGSTGMEQGIAIPHAQDASIKRSAMMVVRLQQPVEWKTFDNQPVDTMISFLIPEHDNGDHLHYLSNTAKLLTHQSFIKQLKAAHTPMQILTLFKE
ncbi:fructose-specific PTS transporter subunit EIIC [Lacticaseibacillus songhuajiangensis]|jgi:fructose-specific phosphotransferase system IIC component/fructose-specific phosphotransferase system IIA component/fructose-specific phosphotransferase system IIB component|uniref:fructose-specific PTS transporter subunit EIIC n=1 Tax=Lacticaseibacillus songhuajiangensis TaxID=1296539 RepID=UPI000F78FD18|nr:fructose-specific PTS transporter subunit EIIC [Lacticaseibacillus songhuajiangensis]